MLNNGTVSTLNYCTSHPSPDFINQGASIISSVQLVGNTSSISNDTYGMPDYYYDYSSYMYADLTPAQSYVVNIALDDLSGGSYPSAAKVFIDYNIDGDFSDIGEEVGIIPYGTTGLTSINFTVPNSSSSGPTRMRIVSQYQTLQAPSLIGPCDAPVSGSFDEPWFGATEDYSIVLSGTCDSTAILDLTILLSGCTDPTAINYDPNSSCDDGTCIDAVYGCTDSLALNYIPSANMDDGSCEFCSINLVDIVSNSCFEDDGAITVQGQGEPSFTFLLEVLNDNNWEEVSVQSSSGIANFNNLQADTFRIIMNDIDGCSDTLGSVSESITSLIDSGYISFDDFILWDDQYSSVIPIGFSFDFYGVTYDSCVISSNSYITFDQSLANGYSAWQINAPVPSPFLQDSINSHPINAIMAPWHDVNPSGVFYDDEGEIIYEVNEGNIHYGVYGSAPNRVFVVRWEENPMYGGTSWVGCDDLFSSNIYLFETTNTIETHILEKPATCTWNSTAAVHGIIDADATNYLIVDDPILNQPRNYPLVWEASNDAWQFTPGSNGSYSTNQITYGGSYTNIITTSPVYGCSDSTALNYDPNASCDDGSCIYMNIYGCTDPEALNYNSLANIDDGSCTYCDLTLDVFFTANTSYTGACDGLAYASASSSYPLVSYYWINSFGITVSTLNSTISLCAGTYTLTIFDGTNNICQLDTTFTILNASTPIFGCTDPAACNFDSTATISNGSCIYPLTYTDIQVACGSYSWNGNTLTNSGIYTYTVSNSLGCDSILVLDLTIDNNSINSTTIDVCDYYYWLENGVSYSNSGVYYDTTYSNSGCYNVEILNLFVNNSTSNSSYISSCYDYYWPLTEMWYSSSGFYSDTSTNSNGCTHTENLYLTINTNSVITDIVAACDSFTWNNGVTYYASSNDTLLLQSANGCDSIIILDLTLSYPTSTNINIDACDYYIWPSNGLTYTVDGFYTDISTNSNGCLQYDTLNLTLSNNTYATDFREACDSFVWIDGITYIAPNNAAIYILPNSMGCDSIITLNLTISFSNSSQTVETVCDSYTWNGLQYTQSGVYDGYLQICMIVIALLY
jgi:hypothetical protein